MAKLFRRGKGASAADDDMTISSGWSVGGSSVSDRIMGRMKKNLSNFGSSGSNGRNNTNASSSVSGGRKKGFGSRSGGGVGGSGGFRSRRSSSTGKMRGQSDLDPSSMVFLGTSGAEDMHEQNMLMGKRRHPSAPVLRPGQSKVDRVGPARVRVPGTQNSEQSKSVNVVNPDFEPTEYSLTELRSMPIEQLETAMIDAGVTRDEILKAIEEAVSMDASIDTIAADQRQNTLVSLFINSGRVKLVRHENRTSLRPPLFTTMSDRSLGSRNSLNERKSQMNSSFKSVEQNPMERALNRLNMNASSTSLNNDAASVGGASLKSTVSLRSSTSSKAQSRKSKVEKILELQTENHQIKRENKSLKKTLKKLLGQLLEAEKKEAMLKKKVDNQSTKDINDEITAKPSTTKNPDQSNNIAEIEDNAVSEGAAIDKWSAHTRRSMDLSTDTSKIPDDFDAKSESEGLDNNSIKKRQGMDISFDAARNDNHKNKYIYVLKKKLKKEREAHKNTEFRMKAEIEILTAEVAGLQRELATSLTSLDEYKKSARESRESASTMKYKLKQATAKVSQLRDEAEARDKLIDTFSRILLQKAGIEGEFDGSVDSSAPGSSGEEKIADLLDLKQLDLADVKKI
ncbi:hypothetical protein ACHAXS_003272 [Conticribra weissflogii]